MIPTVYRTGVLNARFAPPVTWDRERPMVCVYATLPNNTRVKFTRMPSVRFHTSQYHERHLGTTHHNDGTGIVRVQILPSKVVIWYVKKNVSKVSVNNSLMTHPPESAATPKASPPTLRKCSYLLPVRAWRTVPGSSGSSRNGSFHSCRLPRRRKLKPECLNRPFFFSQETVYGVIRVWAHQQRHAVIRPVPQPHTDGSHV